MLKVRLRVFFSQLKKVWKNRKINLQNKIRILKAIVMTAVKYGSEAWALRKADEDLLYVFKRNCSLIVLGTRLTGRGFLLISNLIVASFSLLFSSWLLLNSVWRLEIKTDKIPSKSRFPIWLWYLFNFSISEFVCRIESIISFRKLKLFFASGDL